MCAKKVCFATQCGNQAPLRKGVKSINVISYKDVGLDAKGN
jgi:hypothetical protein